MSRADQIEAAARAMADAYDAWDASESERFSQEVWAKRQRLCADFMDARAALRSALSGAAQPRGEDE